MHGTRHSGGGDASYHPPTNEKCTFYFGEDVIDQLAESLSGGGVVLEDEDSSDDEDNTILGGNIELKAAGLERDDLRRLLLASYVTQATEGTELGIEVSVEELSETLTDAQWVELVMNGQTTPDDTGYYYIEFKDDESGDVAYFLATRGSVRIQNEDEEDLICVNNATFDYYLDWFNGSANKVTASNTVKNMYTVTEIGTIKMLTYERNGDNYTFFETELPYITKPDIQQCMIPIELMVDFLEVSASPEFLSGFEELIKDQDIILRVYELGTLEETETQVEYPIDLTIDMEKTVTFEGTNDEGQTHTVSETEVVTGQTSCIAENTTTEVHETIQYQIVLIAADTWYCTAHRTASENTTTIFQYYDENGEAIQFIPNDITNPLEDAPETPLESFDISGANFDELRQSLSELNVMSLETAIVMRVIEEAADQELNSYEGLEAIIAYYLSNDGYAADSGLGFSNYRLIDFASEYLNIRATSPGGTQKKVKTTYIETVSQGTMEYEDNTDAFLGLWKNDTGTYERGATFNPDGKKVMYTDLYEEDRATACVGDLFENGDEILFELLDWSDNTKKHVYIMKYILYRYTGENYGVTDFEELLRLLGLTTSRTNDYNVNTNSAEGSLLKIVDTDDGVTAEQHLIDGINNVSRYHSAAQNYLPYVDYLIELQETYNVNAAWIVAQGCLETGGGTQGVGVSHNNWYGLGYDGGTGYNYYNSPEECFEDMARTVAQTGPYFRDGREIITEIAYMWVNGEAYDPETADPDWYYVVDGKETVRDILTGAGVDISSVMGGDILEVCAQVTEHYNAIGAQYSVSTTGDNALIWGNIAACWDHPYICCATYVSMVLYQSGALTEDQINSYNYHWTGAGGVPSMLRAAGWTKASISEAEPGDVLVREGYHTMIYAGNGQVWDQSTCSGVRRTGPFTYYDLSGYDVWKAP